MLATRYFSRVAQSARGCAKVSQRSFANLPLTEPLASVPSQSDVVPSDPVLQTSTLSNGVQVATVSSQSPVAAVGVFVRTGSRYETLSNSGASFALKTLAFGSTPNRSSLRLVREFELAGATYTAAAGREQIVYSSETQVGNVKDVVPLLADVLKPRLEEYEIRDLQEQLAADSHAVQSDARAFVFELAHAEAFRNKGLGHPLYIPDSNLGQLDTATLSAFIKRFYTSDRLVVVGTGGVEHDAFVSTVKSHFGDLKQADAAISTPASAYVGGELRLAGNFDTNVVLAFQGVAWNDADIYASKVLQALLGGSYKTLTGEGPGRGVVSRLGSKVAGPVEELATFNVHYSDAGLFGVYGRAQIGHAADLASIIVKEISGAGNNAASDLARAVKQAKASILFDLQRRSSLLEFVGSQAVANRPVQTAAQFAAGIDAVKAADVQRVAKKIFSSRPTLVAVGDVADLPAVDAVYSAVSKA